MNAKAVFGALLETIIKVVVVIIVLMLVYKYTLIAYDYGFRVFGEPAVDTEPGRDVSIKVTEAYDLKDVAQLMENKGLIKDYKLFLLQAKLSSIKKVDPGNYDFNTAMTSEEMITIIVDRIEAAKEAGDSSESQDTKKEDKNNG